MSASMFTRALMQQPPRARATSPQQQQQQQAQAAAAAAAAAASSSSPPSDADVESELVPFQRFLTELASPHSSPPAHREEQLFSFFTQLRVASSLAQIRALDLLAQLLERKPSVILGCTNLLSLIIRILQSSQLKHDHEVSEAETTIVCKLFFLLSSVASEHMNVRDLKRLFRILRRVVERKSPPLLCRLMLSSLADMASSSSAAGHACYVSPTANPSLPLPRPPSRCFDFSGTQSALALPPLEKWPCPKGYTVCMWIRWEAEAKPPAVPQKMGTVPGSSQKLPIAQPIVPRAAGSSASGAAPPAQLAHLQSVPPLTYLYSFLTDKARGIELLVHKHTGAVVVRSVSKGVLQELNTEVRLADKRWTFLSVCHKKPQTFSRSSGSLTVFLNDESKYEGELSYPQLTEALIFNAFGAATHPSKPSLPFQGRFSTISFHTKPLSPLQIQLLYRRGADFCIKVLNQIDRSNKLLSFVSNSITSILGAISNAATTITHSASTGGDEDAEVDASPESSSGKRHAAEANRELFKNLLGLWHPQCVEGHLALDCSPAAASASGAHLPCHASILPGVQLCISRDIRDLIHLAVGGITCFFPLFQHLDVLSPATGSSGGGKAKSTMHARSGSSAPNSSASSPEPTSPTRLRSQSSILPLLFRTLQLMLRDSPSNQLTFLQCSGFQVISYLLLKYTGVYHLSEALLVALEQIVQELSWGASVTKLQAASSTDEHANALTLEALTAAASPTASAAAHPQRKIDLLHTNHHLPVSRAAEKTLYNDAFLHILFNFGLWFRSPTASLQHDHTSSSPSAVLDNLLQQQVPFVVQFECLMLIKSHVLKNPRYFRRLLSAGGGGGAVTNAAAAAAANGSGANALTHYTHVGAASAGPVKFILDSMRRFLNYQTVFDSYAHASATLAQSAASGGSNGNDAAPASLFHPYLAAEVATAVRHLRSLRLEWFGVLRTLMLCPVHNEPANASGTSSPVLSTAPVVRESDISTLVQLICEVSESSASSLSSSEASASSASSSSSSFFPSSSPPPPSSSPSSISLSAHSWILAEYVSFLTSILLRRPDEVLPILLKLGGCQLFVCILARNVKYQHVQLSVIHLLSSIVKHAMAADSTNARSDFSAQLAGVLSSLQVALAECYLTLPTYGALLELLCGLSPGSLMSTPKDGAEFAIEHFCTTAQRMAGGQQAQAQAPFDESGFAHATAPTSPAGPPHVPSFSASPPLESYSASSSGPSSSSSSSTTSASVFRSCVIKLPRGLELLHALVQNNDLLRMRERRKMKERWHQETVRRSQMQQQQEVEREESAAASPRHAPAPVHAHHSSDNIHYDEDESASSEQSLPVIAPFSFYHPSCNPSLHSAAFPVLAPAPLLSFAHLLSDIEMFIFHQPVNAHTLLTKWPVGIAVFLKWLAWRREEPAQQSQQTPQPSPEQYPSPTAAAATAALSADAASEPESEVAASSSSDSSAHATAEEQAIANKLRAVGGDPDDMDSLLSPPLVASEQASHGSIDDFVINSDPAPARSAAPARSPVAAPHNDLYLQALFKQKLLADVDLDSDASSSLPLPLIASRIVESLLFYALINMKDGWVQWRGAMLLLRLEAEQQQQSQEQEDESRGKLPRTAADKGGFSEDSFRSVRRNLLISLFQRLEQCPAGAAVAPTAEGPAGSHLILHFNLTHIVEMLEEMLYFDDPARFTQISYRMVDAEGNDSAEAAAANLRKPSASRSAAASTTQGGGQEWILFDDDEADTASAARSHSRSGSNTEWRVGSPITMAPACFQAEWALVRELLQALVHVQFSLQPMRFNYAPSASSTAIMASAFSPEPNDLAGAPGVPSTDVSSLLATPDESSTPLSSSSSSSFNAANQFRTGGPLRIVIRLLLDCCSAVCFNPESQDSSKRSSSDESQLTQLQDIVSQLGALVHVELASASFTTASGQKHGSSANREWKNRHVLHILWRLCQIMQTLPVAPPRPASSEPVPFPADQMRRILHSTVNQIVESLKPFAAVPAACFEPLEAAPPPSPAAAAAAAAAAEKIVYVSLDVNDEGMLIMDPSFEWSRAASMGSGGQNVAAIEWNTDSPTAPRVARACSEYIASSAQLWHSMERKFAAEFAPENEAREITMRRRLKESGLLESGSQRLFNAMDVQRTAWRTVQTCSYAEVNRRAVADTFYSEHVHRVSEQWRTLAHQLYSEGSAWCSSDIALRRKFWQVDTVEDGYRMRRKLQVCLDGTDHHQASQAYIEHARTIAAAREKADRERAKKEQQRKALLPPSTPVPKKQLPPAGTLHASISSPALSLSRPVTPLPPSRDLTADSPDSSARADVASPSLDESKDLEVAAAAASASTAEPDASVEAARLQQLASSLGSSLKRVGEEDEPEEPDEKDDSENFSGRSEDMEVDRLTGLQQRKATKSDKEEAAASNGAAAAAAAAASGEDWDIVDSASTPLSSASSGAASSASFNPSVGSLYTSPMCTLVLPIGIVYGTLEISAHSLKFTHNPHAEQQLLQQQLIAAEAAARQYAKEGHLRPYAPPPPKSKPFTLPSLDAWRARAKKDRVWPLGSIVAVYRRRYQLQKTALEVFLLNGRNYFLDFGTRAERKTVLRKILALRPPRLIRLCSRSVSELLARSRLTEKWVSRELSSFEYLMHLSTVSGRTYNDINQYPVFPWVISYYPEPKVKLVPVSGGSQANISGSATTPVSVRAVEIKEEDPIDILEVIRAGPSHPDTARVFRDLRKPMGALDPQRLEQILERFNTFFDTSIPPFHYGSHYSNAAIVLFYLMRLEPYASLHIELQAGKFDWSDRLFSSMAGTWKNCCTSLSCYKELTPEFYYDPSPFENINGYDLGTKQDGQVVEDVALPTWAHDSAAEFVRINRLALESEYVSENLHHWIDLIFGFKQKGQAAKDACNLFFHLTYEGAVDISTVKDPVLLDAIKEQIAQFGQTPVQLFKKPHPPRQPLAQAKLQRLTLSSTLAMMLEQSDYHHPRLRSVLLSKDQPVLSIRAFSSKLFTISANFVLGLHLWQPDVTSEVEEMGTHLGANHVPMTRRYALPFTHAVAHVTQLPKHNPVIADACSFTLDGRLLLEGNDWSNGLRVYQASSSVHFDALRHRERGLGSMGPAQPNFGDLKLTLSQNLIQHRERITCIALGKDEKTLVTGSKDCTLLVWSLDVEDTSRVTGIFKEGELFVRPTPKFILRGHEEPIIAVAVESELDVAVSISARGQVMMHSVRKGSFLMHLQVPRVHEVQAKMQEAHAKAIANATAAAVAANHGGVAPIPAAAPASAASSAVSFSVPPSNHLASGLGADSLLGRSRTGSTADSPSAQLHLAKLVQFACDGCLVFYSVVWDSTAKKFQNPQVAKCTLNGRHWVAVGLEEYLQCMAVSGDGKLIATGSEDGMLVLRRLHDLKVVQRFEPVMSSITSLAFSYEQDYLFVGTSSGHMAIFAVKC